MRRHHELGTLLKDAVLAFGLAAEASASSLLQSWLYVPLGIILILLVCFGMDVLLKLGQVSFPSSVAVLILFYLGLLLSEWLLGNRRTRKAVALLEVPASWALRWINVVFTPTFVCLPLSSYISAVEVGKIIAVFIIGFVVMMIVTAYMTRGLQLLTKGSKKAAVERAEELGEDQYDIPMTETPVEDESRINSVAGSTVGLVDLAAPPAVQGPPGRRSNESFRRTGNQTDEPGVLMRQVPPPPARCRIWAAYISNHMDLIIYSAMLLFIGIPVFYATGYAMPLHLSINILAYFGAVAIPASWKRLLHPVIVSAFATALAIWLFGLTRHQPLPDTLRAYRTGNKYLQLWRGASAGGPGAMPGAGDMLGTVLDASIVALALPMFQYRRELREHFLAIIAPNVLLSVAMLFSQPPVCRAVGISAERSLAFAARSLTLALATPAVDNLGGDRDTIAAVAIMSGIVGALVGQKILQWLRIPDDDYVTRGVTLGANSSAVATALLLKTDPRAAALSSLSMSLFGTITVLFTSIPPISAMIRSLVGL